MKRFYCTICKKVKRVRQWPANVMEVDSISPHDRVGSCNYHAERASRAVIRRGSVTKTRKMVS